MKTLTIEEFESIDFKPLENFLSIHFGQIISLNHLLSNGKIKISSNSLKEYTGIMQSVFDELVITDFGGVKCEDSNEYWLPLNFSFSYKSGGSNGIRIFDAVWSFDKKLWNIK